MSSKLSADGEDGAPVDGLMASERSADSTNSIGGQEYKNLSPVHTRSVSSQDDPVSSFIPPPRRSEEAASVIASRTRGNRSFSSGSNTSQFPPRGTSFGVLGPGSFSANMKSTASTRTTTPKNEINNPWSAQVGKEADGLGTSEQRQAVVMGKIAKETKIKLGTENMLEVLLTKNSKQTREQRLKVENELSSSNRKIAALKLELEEEMQRANSPSTPPRQPANGSYRGSPLRSPSRGGDNADGEAGTATNFESESPTYVLTETLQELEVDSMTPDYYIERANKLVELFKRNPTLKYDLAWNVFGVRMQTMLLSDRTEVVAAGYRLTRYAIADRTSIQRIRSHHTDELVTLSLVKKGKAILEREQALKFVRAFLDVKDGVREISRAVVRTIVSVSEHSDDRLRHMCTLTLIEILAKDAATVVAAGGMSTLTDTLSEGTFPASDGLAAGLLHIFDYPSGRRSLKSGRELECVFAPFTDPLYAGGQEENLKACAKAIAAMLKTWPGFLTLSMQRALAIRSLLESLKYPSIQAKDLILELLFDVLRIKQPPIFTTFLAGRRLTTYGRVANVRSEDVLESSAIESDYGADRYDLKAHFTALVLATFLEAGLVPSLIALVEEEDDQAIKRKATLLLTEVLKLADRSLPSTMSVHFQVLPGLQAKFIRNGIATGGGNNGMIFLIDSISRILNRFEAANQSPVKQRSLEGVNNPGRKSKLPPVLDEESFRKAMLETGIVTGREWALWKWDLIQDIIEGPLTEPVRLGEAMRFGKFMKRLVGFYRPFKGKFSKCYNNKSSQRYIKAGCALMKSLVKTVEGSKYLIEDKLLRQVAECLAQIDRLSGITSSTPIFSRAGMTSSMSGGYFQMLGALSTEPRGIVMMERWHMINMFYHIIDLHDRPDLIQALLANMDYSSESHLRVMLSKALTAGAKDTRLIATRLLRKYIIGVKPPVSTFGQKNSQWVLKLLLTQLYDPDVEVGETAVRILEEACNKRENLEFVVKCRPALDHLGEIGAPLLLRFLSTSVGYHYLDNLDYITQEMDDWFLGRNDAYVNLVEASLSRAYNGHFSKAVTGTEELMPIEDLGVAPPHFYRELARTSEGCRLLRQSGHFYEFASSVHDFDVTEEDPEALLKIKGCLWAIGNVGSMELGAPFLEESEVVSSIIRIAEQAQVMSLRGTACFVLGLISRSAHGLEMIMEHGWDTASNMHGESLGLCMPRDLGRLSKIEFSRPPVDRREEADLIRKFKAAKSDPDPLHARILKSMVDLGNAVLSKRAASELNAAKAKKPDAFRDVGLFRKTLIILESHHVKFPARQFALDLFDKEVLRSVVLDEDSDDSDDG